MNASMLAIWSKDSNVVGLPFELAIPEVADQPFAGLLKDVWRTGNSYQATDTAAVLLVNGTPLTCYFDFSYKAIKRESGDVYAILHTAIDVTEKVLRNQAMVRLRDKQRLADEELTAAIIAYNELKHINEDLTANEQNARQVMLKAPVALGVLCGA